jgi:hypothetical protein
VRKDLQTVKIKNWKKSVLNIDYGRQLLSGPNLTHSCSVYQQEDILILHVINFSGPGSSVGIAPGYGMDGPGI